MKKALFTDIDGTLSYGFLSVDFVRFLNKRNLFDKEQFLIHEKIIDSYYKNKETYFSLCKKWWDCWRKGTKGIKKALIEKQAKIFMMRNKKKIFKSSFELIELCKKKGFITIGITAGAQEVFNEFKKIVGLDLIQGVQLSEKNGVYIGRLKGLIHRKNGKKKTIKKIALENNINLENSVGLGDSLHDIQIFSLVGKVIALNASSNLLKRFVLKRKQKWYVATHKNVINIMNNCFEKEENNKQFKQVFPIKYQQRSLK